MRVRSRLAAGALAVFLAGVAAGPTGMADTADAGSKRDPVANAVEEVGDAIAALFGRFGRSVERAGNEMERMFTGRSRKTVPYDRKYRPGTIVISTKERNLYYVTARGRALRYRVGVGREGFAWSGRSHVSRKARWPSWRPPPEMLKRRPDLPRYMPGGPDNPLGARALYLGDTLYRIHGTREAHTIGGAVSSGCIRLLNADVIDLYRRVSIGSPVYVYH